MSDQAKAAAINEDLDIKARQDHFEKWLEGDLRVRGHNPKRSHNLTKRLQGFKKFLLKRNSSAANKAKESIFQYSEPLEFEAINREINEDKAIMGSVEAKNSSSNFRAAVNDYGRFLEWTKQSANQSNGGEDSMEAQIDKYVEMLKRVHNIIFHGAPGTGKTYMARRIAERMTKLSGTKLNGSDQFAFVQFHPSYDYTDFVEGLRPVSSENSDNPGHKEMSFELYPGTFMEIANRARREWESCANTEQAPQKYVIVIDEINRGDISKIFGELFFSVDPDYRGESGSIDTQYRNLHGSEFKKRGGLDSNEKFYVPENLYIIGTMNDIDRSVDSFDFAMRRRFTFIEITAEKSEFMLCGDEKHSENAKTVMEAVNDKIASPNFLDENYQIGASYFLDVVDPKIGDSDEKEVYTHLWNDKIGPLIHEYLRGMDDSSKSFKAVKGAFDDAVAEIKKSNDGAESNSQSNSDSNSANIKNNQQNAPQSDDHSGND